MKESGTPFPLVIEIATHLLQLDGSYWQEPYHAEAHDLIASLYHALARYQHLSSISSKNLQESTLREKKAHALKQLQCQVQTFLKILIPDAQQQIQQHFNVNPTT